MAWRVAEDSRSLTVSCNVRDETRCETKQCQLLSIHELFFVLHYIKRQAMLWRNAPAKLAPAETVRASNAAVQAMLWRNAPANVAPAETVRALNGTVREEDW